MIKQRRFMQSSCVFTLTKIIN